MRPFVICDVEADGPHPGKYNMVSFGLVLYADRSKTFYGKTKPLTEHYVPSALEACKTTRAQHETYEHPEIVMKRMEAWLKEVMPEGQRPVFFSDNPAFDWQWMNYNSHMFLGYNPFGFSARRMGDLYAGAVGDLRKTGDWRRFRLTKHTHNPVDDATGVAEALERVIEMYF